MLIRPRLGKPPGKSVSGWLLAAVALLYAVALPTLAQPSPAASAQEQSIQPTAPARIPAEAEAVRELLRQIQNRLQNRSLLPELAAQTFDIRSRVDQLHEETTAALEGKAWFRLLDDLQRNWTAQNDRIRTWQERLSARNSEIDRDLGVIEEKRQLWRQTMLSLQSELAPALANRVNSTVFALEAAESQLVERQRQLFELQDQLAEMQSLCESELRSIAIASRANLLSFDSRPLWTAMLQPERQRFGGFQRLGPQLQAVATYLLSENRRLATQALIFLAFLLPLVMLRRRRAGVRKEGLRILETPISSALLLTLILTRVVHPHAPRLLYALAALLLVVPLLRVVPRAIGRFHRQIYTLTVVYILDVLVDFTIDDTLAGRILLLGIAVVALLILTLVTHQLWNRWVNNQAWSKFFVIGTRTAQGLLVFSVLANVMGSVSLAGVVTDAVLRSVYAILILWAAVSVLNQGMEAFVRSHIAEQLRIVQLHGEIIVSKWKRSLLWLGGALWGIYTLSGFRLAAPLWAQLKAILTAPLQVGNLNVSLGDVLSFAAVIWLSFVISRGIRFILEEEALHRVTMPRGLPATISRLTHYAILFFGFLIAVTAAGLGLDRITLLAGAFGVGIGFGLQNIVNNLVSGLILLFERPIKIGDQVQIGSLIGRVTTIGIRSSIIRAWDGSEVIVPNGNLISEVVTNWTLSDQLRRMEIVVGVAYGTDPDRVLKLLHGVAENHTQILKDPPPMALFTGFGDSSLNFSLRAWTDQIDNFVVIRSELAVRVNRALKEAGIEIPFPQRDVYVREMKKGD